MSISAPGARLYSRRSAMTLPWQAGIRHGILTSITTEAYGPLAVRGPKYASSSSGGAVFMTPQIPGGPSTDARQSRCLWQLPPSRSHRGGLWIQISRAG